jgi:hypothetical protein
VLIDLLSLINRHFIRERTVSRDSFMSSGFLRLYARADPQWQKSIHITTILEKSHTFFKGIEIRGQAP